MTQEEKTAVRAINYNDAELERLAFATPTTELTRWVNERMIDNAIQTEILHQVYGWDIERIKSLTK